MTEYDYETLPENFSMTIHLIADVGEHTIMCP